MSHHPCFPFYVPLSLSMFFHHVPSNVKLIFQLTPFYLWFDDSPNINVFCLDLMFWKVIKIIKSHISIII